MSEPTWMSEMRKAARNGDPHYTGIAYIDTMKLLERNPNLMQIYQNRFGKTVKLDNHTLSIIFYTGLSAYVIDYDNKLTPLNLFLKGESSTGKTYNVVEVIKNFPKNDVWWLGAMSPKALVRQHGEVVDRDDQPIDMTQKPSPRKLYRPRRRKTETDSSYEERLRLHENDKAEYDQERLEWQEKIKGAKYIIDLSGKILVFLEAPQEETFLMLRPILSHDVREIAYPYVDTSSGVRTVNVVLRGWCATIFCTTKIDYLEQLSTRSFTASPLATAEKFEAAKKHTGFRVAHPYDLEGDEEEGFVLQGYIANLNQQSFGQKRYDKEQSEPPFVKPINPIGEKFAACFKSSAARGMRDIKHVFALMNVSAMFHYAQRPIIQIGEGFDRVDYVMVTMEDVENVASFLPEIGSTTVSGMPQEVVDIFEQVCKPLSDENEDGFSRNEAVDRQNEVFPHHHRAYTFISKVIKTLEKGSYITSFKRRDDKKTLYYRVIGNPENPFKVSLIDFLESFSETDFTSWLATMRKNLAEKSITIRDQFHSENYIESAEQLYKRYYIPDPSLRTILAQDILKPIPEKKGIDRFFPSTKDNARLSKEKTPFLQKIKFKGGVAWLDADQRKRDICYICGKGEEIAATYRDYENQTHEICETCAHKIMIEARRVGES